MQTNNDIPAAVQTPAQVDLIECRRDPVRHPRIANMGTAEAVSQMRQILLRAYLYRGQTADDTLVNFTASVLVEELTADMDGLGLKYITFREIAYVVRKSIMGQGRELFGLSVSSIYAALADYAKGEGHLIQVQAEAQAKAERRPKTLALDTALTSAAVEIAKKMKI